MSKKKTVKKKSKKTKLKVSNPEKFFYTVEGKAIKSLIGLADALDDISDAVFFHHVNEDKNDFANWVKEVFEEPSLAKELEKTTEPMKTQIIILKHIVKKRGK
ncbi:hypothetical protein GOV08_03860 [Candidatus Woesearchaeota archaeon]|nr:hypothetical protein [Candidatus Woesearchaeota archaeon]